MSADTRPAAGVRVCVLTTSFPRRAGDDAGIFVARLVDALGEASASGVVVVPRDADEPPNEARGRFEVRRYRYGVFGRESLAFGAGIIPNLRARPLRILQAPLLVAGLIAGAWRARRDVSVVHANWIIAAWAAWISGLATRVPYVITLRGEDVRLLRSRAAHLLFGPALRRAHAVVTVNEQFVSEIAKIHRLGAGRITCIPNGVGVRAPTEEEVRSFAARRGLAPERKRLLFVGTVIPRKRVDLLVRLVADPALAGYDLLICGRTDDRDYVERIAALARELGCSDRLRLEGPVAPEEVPLYHAYATCYVTASEFEGRSNALLEALAAGSVVFASDIDAHAEVVRDGENGFLFDPDAPARAAARIREVANDERLRERIRDAARASCRACTWAASAGRYLELFRGAEASRHS